MHVFITRVSAGDLYDESQILSWLMTQKDPGGDVIEDIDGQRLIDMIEESGSMAVYFCEYSYCIWSIAQLWYTRTYLYV